MADTKTGGPRIRLDMSCFSCVYCESESYAVQGDSGHDVYCTRTPGGRKHIGDTTWDTPQWCPLRATALREFLKEQEKQ